MSRAVCFSPDGNLVYFTRNNMSLGNKRRDDRGIQHLKIYSAEVTEEGKWIKERELPINSKDYSVGHPSLSADGKVMYFTSNMPGGIGGADIYKVNISYGKYQFLSKRPKIYNTDSHLFANTL